MLLAALSSATAVAQRPIDVTHYDARVVPDLAAKTVSGSVVVTLRVDVPALAALALDTGALTIDAVRLRSASLAHSVADKKLHITLPRPARAGDTFTITIDYHGAPKFGLEFRPDRSEIYTIFSTSQWMPAIDAPGDRASLDLRVTLPAGLAAVGNGRLVSRTRTDDGRETLHWRQRRPLPSYLYGFAAGRYREVREQRGGISLRHLATSFDEKQLQQIFADTSDMLRFFARRAGVRYPDERYTQALVAQTIGQELGGFALMSEDYGREVLDDARASGLIAHEIAHQWWGNGVTCDDWGHFWLNEGFANYMTAAYFEQRYGRNEYDRRIERWRKRVDELKAAGKDHALVYAQWNKPTADDRAVVYQKGAYVLHLLRERVGDAAFWKGIRGYTRKHFGKAVTTVDFQRAMERASGEDLDDFFARWVYAASH